MTRGGASEATRKSAALQAGRRDRALPRSIAFLGVEGIALVVGRGNCPLGLFQRDLGDPVPFFELVLRRRGGEGCRSGSRRREPSGYRGYRRGGVAGPRAEDLPDTTSE